MIKKDLLISKKSRVKALLCFVLLAIFSSAYADSYNRLYDMLQNAKSGGKYVEPDNPKLRQAEKLFLNVLNGQSNKNIKKQWQDLGFKLISLKLKNDSLIVLKETKKEGKGFYIFRPNSNHSVLQAPHSFYDLYTDAIALKLFLDNSFSAVAFNTTHRRKADMAHMKNTYFTAFSRAFIKQNAKNYLIQLHGFSQK